ncbi:hypothetical protein M0R45_006563 [Rubus argutus]
MNGGELGGAGWESARAGVGVGVGCGREHGDRSGFVAGLLATTWELRRRRRRCEGKGDAVLGEKRMIPAAY